MTKNFHMNYYLVYLLASSRSFKGLALMQNISAKVPAFEEIIQVVMEEIHRHFSRVNDAFMMYIV